MTQAQELHAVEMRIRYGGERLAEINRERDHNKRVDMLRKFWAQQTEDRAFIGRKINPPQRRKKKVTNA